VEDGGVPDLLNGRGARGGGDFLREGFAFLL